jgi:hypothetical protein
MYKNTFISLLTAAILSGCGSDSTSSEVEQEAIVNSAPQAITDLALVQNNVKKTIDVLSNDTDKDNDRLTISSIINQPKSGTVKIFDNKIIYTPELNVATTETITYEVSDGELTAEGNVEVTVNHTMTLSGLITDSPIANALVSITIGDEVFEAEADARGNYSLPVIINDMSALIVIRAKGNKNNGQENVELISIVGSSNNLLTLIDDERQLTNHKSNITNVTHISTATYLLVKERSENGEVSTEEEFNKLVGDITAEELIETAGFIKLLVDNTSFVIPEGKTVLSLFETRDIEGKVLTTSSVIDAYLVISEFTDENGGAIKVFEDALELAIEATLSDPNVIEQFTADDIAGKIMIGHNDAREGWNAPSGRGFNFATNGTGKSYSSVSQIYSTAIEGSFNWSIVEGHLNVTHLDGFNETIIYSDFPYENLVSEHGFTQSLVDELVTAYSAGLIEEYLTLEANFGNSNEVFTLLSTTPTNYLVNVSGESFTELTLPAGVDWADSTPRATEFFSKGQLLVHTPKSTFEDKALEDLEGEWVLSLEAMIVDSNTLESVVEVMSDVVNIHDTIADAQFANQQFSTSLSQGVLVLTNEDGTYKFTPFKSEGKGYLTKVEKWLDNELKFVFATQIAKFDDSYNALTENLVTELPSIQAAFLYGGFEEQWDGDKLKLEYIWGYQFELNGTLKRGVFGLPKSDTWNHHDVDYFDLGDNRWTWNNTGRQVNMYLVSEWRDRHRTWEVISVDGQGRALVFEHSVYGWDRDEDGDIEDNEIGQYIRPRINTIMLNDLSRWEDVWKNTIELGLYSPNGNGVKSLPFEAVR